MRILPISCFISTDYMQLSVAQAYSCSRENHTCLTFMITNTAFSKVIVWVLSSSYDVYLPCLISHHCLVIPLKDNLQLDECRQRTWKSISSMSRRSACVRVTWKRFVEDKVAFRQTAGGTHQTPQETAACGLSTHRLNTAQRPRVWLVQAVRQPHFSHFAIELVTWSAIKAGSFCRHSKLFQEEKENWPSWLTSKNK